MQFAPDGARIVQRDSDTGETRETLADAPDRQFPILRDGAQPR